MSICVENALLKPRDTMFACARPPAEIDRPGTAFKWSVTVSDGRSSICAAVTTEIGFGES